jgi:hypothetical protein
VRDNVAIAVEDALEVAQLAIDGRQRTSRDFAHGDIERYDFPRMDGDYDPEREAEAAMKRAVMAVGPERQRWIGLAMAWQELVRMRLPRAPCRESAATA